MCVCPNTHDRSVAQSRLIQELQEVYTGEKRTDRPVDLSEELGSELWVVQDSLSLESDLCCMWVVLEESEGLVGILQRRYDNLASRGDGSIAAIEVGEWLLDFARCGVLLVEGRHPEYHARGMESGRE